MKKFNTNFSVIFIFTLVFSQDIFSQVTEQWKHRYTGPQASTDEAARFTLDPTGNTYVTGTTIVGGGYSDISTVKFNSSGIREWISIFNGPGNQNESGTDVKVDASGNVYTLGNTYNSLQDFNFVLIKYNQNGVQQWFQEYNGTANSSDISISMDMDNAGNLYAGGFSAGAGTGYDFVLVKYNSAGIQQWVQRWNGSSSSDDYLKKISVASNGDIIVCGSSYSASTSSDFVTLRYSPSGSLIWTKKYNDINNNWDEVTNLKSDSKNNIYLCGKSTGSGGFDFVTVKYNFDGDLKWSVKYISPGNGDDVPVSLTVDLNGNVLVTGYTNTINSFQDYLTIKYDSNGVSQWIRTFNGAENYFDKAYDVKTDSLNNVYVTGQNIKFTDGTSDIVTLKYNSSGTLQWSKLYDGPGQLDDIPVQMELKSGYLYIIASSYSYFFNPFCGATDYLTLKLNTNSDVIWETRYDGAGTGIDESIAMAIDNSGNTYVTGLSFDNVSDYDYATVKYNSAGAPLWVSRYDNISGADKPNAIAVDNNGNIYVTGSSQGISGGKDIATIKYNSNGSELWVARYNGTGSGDDFGVSVLSDNSGNVYVSGYREGAGSGKDYVLFKYNSLGVQQWVSEYNGPGNSDDLITSMFLESSGSVILTGKSFGIGTMDDIATIKYNSSGILQWVSRFNSPGNNSDIGNSV
ncbi:MAG TPA: SBBP repeat-containing protein, partial [Ignavibacteria bacterium]|nr:SBBP repeat-containing protein [Ignavibacteria bacterium]